MKILNILTIICLIIILYIIIKNYYKNKEKFTSTCTASLTDWEKLTSQPQTGNELTDAKWEVLKGRLLATTKNKITFSLNDNLFLDTNNVLDYTIDINDYLKFNRNGVEEYWKPTKKWKDGVISHFCKELCILKLGYEWIKMESTENIQNFVELSTGIGEDKRNSIRELIKTNLNNGYAKLDETSFNQIIGASYVNTNNYIQVDGVNYKVAVNIPLGRKWKVGRQYGDYLSTDSIVLNDTSDPIVAYFNSLQANIGDTIVLTKNKYDELFSQFDLKENHVIHPNIGEKCFLVEYFEYDKCYQKSCAIFAEKEFDDYLKLINLRESMGFKATSFQHTTEIMDTSDTNLLNLVNRLQNTINDNKRTGDCSDELIYNKMMEVIKKGEFVRQDDSWDTTNCPPTYDAHTYVIKPTEGILATYNNICNDLDEKIYRKKINPEIYKYITSDWIHKSENSDYNFENTWSDIKNDINLSSKSNNGNNDSLKNKIISKNQLSELIVKYLDDSELMLHEYIRKPSCHGSLCYGKCIVIEKPNNKGTYMDSKNNDVGNDIIELYTDEYVHKWEQVSTAANTVSLTNTVLGNQLSNKKEFSESEWTSLSAESIIVNTIYTYNGINYKYLGLLPKYIRMGKIASNKYKEITANNVNNVGITTEGNILKSACDISQKKGNLVNLNERMKNEYDRLCFQYSDSDYKLYDNYNKVEFIKIDSIPTNAIDLSTLGQKTVKLNKINSDEKTKIFSTSGLSTECKFNECKDLGNITDTTKISLLSQHETAADNNIIIININDFGRIINNYNILENDYISTNNQNYYKVSTIYTDNIITKITSDFEQSEFPNKYIYTYDNFISINIDLHEIDVNQTYFVTVNSYIYKLVMDDVLKEFISRYIIQYDSITNVNLTNTEKCINDSGVSFFMSQELAEDTSLDSLNNSKNSWIAKNFEDEYDDTYRIAIGYNTSSPLTDVHANYWQNKFHNDNVCSDVGNPLNGNAQDSEDHLYYVNPNYNYGLKWLKLDPQPDTDELTNKTIIKIYDYNVITNTIDKNELSISMESKQNDVRFVNNSGGFVDMGVIDETYYLEVKFTESGQTETIYYKVHGSNKCSTSQICSSNTNEYYNTVFNNKLQTLYNEQKKCDELNNEPYNNRYAPDGIKSSFKTNKGFEINEIDKDNYDLYPKNYDISGYNEHIFT